MNFSGNLSGIAAPLATGFLIARTNSYFPGFVVAVIVLLAGIPVYWWMVGEKRGGADEPANMQWLSVEESKAKTAGEQR